MHGFVIYSHLCQTAEAICGQTADACILLSCCVHTLHLAAPGLQEV